MLTIRCEMMPKCFQAISIMLPLIWGDIVAGVVYALVLSQHKIFSIFRVDAHINSCYYDDDMKHKVDLLPLSLKDCKVSAFHRVWIKLGLGFHCRARATAQGYDIRLRYGANDETKRLLVKVEFDTKRADGVPRPTLKCSACGKFVTKYLYLDTVKFEWKCAPCLGVKPWQIRVPMRWDLGEETKFRHLLRRKVDQDILEFELAALRTLSPSEFFASRPYLVPPWVEKVMELDPNLYQKMLRILHNKYRSVMMKRKVKTINEKESQWLMEKLGIVFEKASIITRKEVTWLRNRQSQLQSKVYKAGNQPGSELEQSSLLLSVTDSLSQRMSSAAAMNVGIAQALGSSPAKPAKEQEATNEEIESSSVLNAEDQED